MTDLGGMFHVEPQTPGQRLFLIRLACGDGIRKPESMRDFAERVHIATGAEYEHSTIGMLERDLQGWRLKDAKAFAIVDPLKRGEAWLAFGNEPPAEPLPAPGEPRVPRPDPRPAKVAEPSTSSTSGRKKHRKR
jgi:hypothetical protein